MRSENRRRTSHHFPFPRSQVSDRKSIRFATYIALGLEHTSSFLPDIFLRRRTRRILRSMQLALPRLARRVWSRMQRRIESKKYRQLHPHVIRWSVDDYNSILTRPRSHPLIPSCWAHAGRNPHERFFRRVPNIDLAHPRRKPSRANISQHHNRRTMEETLTWTCKGFFRCAPNVG